MSEPKNADRDDSTTANDPPPGPTDQGRTGGMATREVAPDVAENSDEPPD